MADLTTWQVTDGLSDILAVQMNRLLNSAITIDTVNTQSIGADKTLTDLDLPTQILTPSTFVNVILPVVASTNHAFYFVNGSSSYPLTIKNAGGTVISVIGGLASGIVVSNSAIWSNIGISNREVLTAARTYYVRADGNDAYNGYANTAGSAFLTLQHAVDTVAALDMSIYNVIIQLVDGTYGAGCTITGPWVGSGTVTIQGNVGTPANVIVQGKILATSGARVTVTGLKFVTSTLGLHASYDATITFSNINFGACTTAHMRAEYGGNLVCSGSYAISGAAAAHWDIRQGMLLCFGVTITITGTPAFGTAFAFATRSGLMAIPTITFSGSATGLRYSATLNGVIDTSSGGATYLPGNSSGTTATGGQYN